MRAEYLSRASTQLQTLKGRLDAIACDGGRGLISATIFAYERKMAEDLTLVFAIEEEPERNILLIQLLSDWWDITANTRLSYTAMPDNQANRLLMTLACGLSDGTVISALKRLMPTLELTSLTLPSKFVFEGWDNEAEVSPDLVANVHHICRTHLLKENGNSLFPVWCLASLESLRFGERVVITDYYYDSAIETAGDTPGILTNSECHRLYQHSEQTRTVFAAFESWQLIASDQGHLYGRLTHLASKLYFNSVYGIGDEMLAGAGGAAAMHSFFDYYFLLDERVRQALPDPLKLEIKILLACVSDYHHKLEANTAERLNENGTPFRIEPIEICLATRRDDLLNAMRGCEEVLSIIHVAGEAKESQVRQTKRYFMDCFEALRIALNQGVYNGTDSLPLTSSLLTTLDLTVRFENLDDVQAFYQGLERDEISEFHIADDNLAKKIVNALCSFEDLVLLLHALPPLEMEAVFIALVPELLSAEGMLKSGGNLSALLSSFGTEKMSLLWSVIINDEHNTLTVLTFVRILEFLTAEQSQIVIQAIPTGRWAAIIQIAADVNIALWQLTTEQSRAVTQAIPADHWTAMIQSPVDVNIALKFLTVEQSRIFIDAVPADHWTTVIQSAADVNIALKFLTVEQSRLLIQVIPADHWTTVIRTATDLSSALRSLITEQCQIVIDTITVAHWTTVIRTAADVNTALKFLTAKESQMLIQAIPAEHWATVIRSAADVASVLRGLTIEQCRVVIQAILAERWTVIIRSAADVGRALYGLRAEQRRGVIEAIGKAGLFSLVFTPEYNKHAPSLSLRRFSIFARPHSQNLEEAEAYARRNPSSTTAKTLLALFRG